MIAGGEGQLPLQADPPRGQADGPFGGDVDGLRLEGLEALLHRLVGPDGQLDLRIGGQGEGLELVGADHLDLVAHLAQLGDHPGQGAHHAVDLRLPGVGGQQDAHRAGDRGGVHWRHSIGSRPPKANWAIPAPSTLPGSPPPPTWRDLNKAILPRAPLHGGRC